MGQPALFPETPPSLTPRQQLVHDALHVAAHDGLNTDQAGHVVHVNRGCRYCRDAPCQYAHKEGKEILERLVTLNLATRRRHGRYTAPGYSLNEETDAAADTGYDPSTTDIPF